MSNAEILNELEIELAVGETAATRKKVPFSVRRIGPCEEKLISVTGVSGVRIDLSSFSSVRQVLIENLNTTKYVRATWTDSGTSDIPTVTIAALQTILIPAPSPGTSAVPLLTLVPETGATCLCRLFIIGAEA